MSMVQHLLECPYMAMHPPALIAEINLLMGGSRLAGHRRPEAARAVQNGLSGNAKRVAVHPLFGTMTQHDGWFGTSTEQYKHQLLELDKDPTVGAIVMEIHSPGGQVWGTEELADAVWGIRQRGDTRIYAMANSMAASAALWVGSQAERLYATQNAELGSIGVLTVHEDISKMLEKVGVTMELIATPEKKVEGNPFEPLTDSVRDEIRADNDRTYRRFVQAVARGRDVSAAQVEGEFGRGGMLFAEEAQAVRMVDGVGSIDDILAEVVTEVSAPERVSVGVAQAKLRLEMTR